MATVTASLKNGTAVDIRSRQFLWRSDEPPAAKGADSGPTPYEFLLGSLAACTAITLRLYATHKGIPLTGVTVALDFDRVHANDCLDCDDDATGVIEQIRSTVTLHGDLNAAQRARLTQVASRCPVHKTLDRGLEVIDSVKFPDATD